MNSASTLFPPHASCSLRDLTLFPLRLTLARVLVLVSFLWPFFNYDYFFPGNATEVNFLPVLFAAAILPEVMFHDASATLLSIPAFAVACLWAPASAPARLAIAIVPLVFLLNLSACLRLQGSELIPQNIAYRALQVFTVFSLIQTVDFFLVRIIPGWLTAALNALVPRYSGLPYDESGIRGVQGWASEPSSAALTCVSFALVALRQRPDRRWRVLSLFIVLLLLNKSFYALVLGIMLALGCIFTLRRKLVASVTLIPLGALVGLYIAASGRIVELVDSVSMNGLDRETNHELMRFAQILSPLEQFPHIYQPVTIFDVWVPEPMGLLPLLAGYGGIIGVAWLAWLLRRHFRLSDTCSSPLVIVAGLVLLVMASPDFIPSIVALTVFTRVGIRAIDSSTEVFPSTFRSRTP